VAVTFTNYKQQRVVLEDAISDHIAEAHPEVSLALIKATLEDPDEVRESSYKNDSELYYSRRTLRRYTCVVVKICRDGNFISTALTTAKPKVGRLIYKKDG
jgi:hypothetical protein